MTGGAAAEQGKLAAGQAGPPGRHDHVRLIRAGERGTVQQELIPGQRERPLPCAGRRLRQQRPACVGRESDDASWIQRAVADHDHATLSPVQFKFRQPGDSISGCGRAGPGLAVRPAVQRLGPG